MRSFVTFVSILISFSLFCQVLPPYKQNFESDIHGWSNSHSSAVNLWTVSHDNLYQTHSGSRAYVIEFPEPNIEKRTSYLTSPAFDLTYMPKDLYLSFYFSYVYDGSEISVEYLIDKTGWKLLDEGLEKSFNWPKLPYKNDNGRTVVYGGRYNDPFTGYKFCAHSLKFLEGNNNVKFRIKLQTPGGYEEVFAIDDFKIDIDKSNLKVFNSDESVNIKNVSEEFKVTFPVRLERYHDEDITFNIEYFLSTDSIHDQTDVLISSGIGHNTGSGIMNVGIAGDGQMRLPDSIEEGFYYIIYKVNPNDKFDEINYDDNSGFIHLNFIKKLQLPHQNPVEIGQSLLYNEDLINWSGWNKGDAGAILINKPPSGEICWYQVPINNGGLSESRVIKTFNFDLPDSDQSFICSFWFLNETESMTCRIYSGTNYLKSIQLPATSFYQWQHYLIDLNEFKSKNNLNIEFQNYDNTYTFVGAAIDDIYIGESKPDLAINTSGEVYVNAENNLDSIYYNLANYGANDASSFKLNCYLSSDNILNKNSDKLIHSEVFPGLEAKDTIKGKLVCNYSDQHFPFYVFYEIETDNSFHECWEWNNQSCIRVDSIPYALANYVHNFDTIDKKWVVIEKGKGNINIEKYSTTLYNSKNEIWGDSVVHYKVVHPENMVSYLYSPVIDISELTMPVVSYDFEDRGFEYCFIEYTNDGGNSWNLLKEHNLSFERNTNSNEINLEKFRTYRRSYDISNLAYNKVRYRFVFLGNTSYECLVDNFKVANAIAEVKMLYANVVKPNNKNDKVFFDLELRNYSPLYIDNIKLECYYSFDTVYDSTDLLFYSDAYEDFMPGTKIQHLDSVNVTNLDLYKSLIFVVKSNEICHDTMVVMLKEQAINQFPFHETFSNRESVQKWSSTSTIDDHRIRPVAVRNDENIIDRWESDYLPYWADPELVIESPVFDFSNLDTVFVSFQLRSRGGIYGSRTGGFLQYSKDDGTNWEVLGTRGDGLGYGWYNEYMSYDGSMLPAWMDWEEYYTRVYDATKSIAGSDSVVFRFVFRPNSNNNYTREVFFDNFCIDTVSPVFGIQGFIDKTQSLKRNGFSYLIKFGLINKGNMLPGAYSVSLYYSNDTILSATDMRIKTIEGPQIAPNDTLYIDTDFSYSDCSNNVYIIVDVKYDETVYNSLPIIHEYPNVFYKAVFADNAISFKGIENDTIYACKSADLTLAIDDDDFFSYEWSDNSNNSYLNISTEGSHWVKVSNRYGCYVGKKTVEVVYYPEQESDMLIDISVNSDTLFFTHPENQTVQWQNSKELNIMSNKELGYYYYYFNDSNNCENRSVPLCNLVKAGEYQGQVFYTDSLFCDGDSVEVIAQVANRYKWSNNESTQRIQVKNTGSYTANLVYLSDTIETNNAHFTKLSYPEKSLTYLNDSICRGDTLFVRAEKNKEYTYRWNTGSRSDSILLWEIGAYYVDIVNNGRCETRSDTLNLDYFPNPLTPSIFQKGFSLLSDDTINASIWISGTDTLLYNANAPFYPPANGYYQVISENKHGCQTKSFSHFYSSPTDSIDIIVAPNPFIDNAIVNFSLDNDADIELTMQQMDGQIIFTAQMRLESGHHYYNLNSYNIPTGVNILSITKNKKHYKSIKIIRMQ